MYRLFYVSLLVLYIIACFVLYCKRFHYRTSETEDAIAKGLIYPVLQYLNTKIAYGQKTKAYKEEI